MMRPITEIRCTHCGTEIGTLDETVQHKWGVEHRIFFNVKMCDCFWKQLPKRILDDILEEAKEALGDDLKDEIYTEALETVDQDVWDQLAQAKEDAELWQFRCSEVNQKYEALLLAAAKIEEELAILKEDTATRPFLIV